MWSWRRRGRSPSPSSRGHSRARPFTCERRGAASRAASTARTTCARPSATPIGRRWSSSWCPAPGRTPPLKLPRMLRRALPLACAVLLCAAGAAQGATPPLRAGTGRADITPPTGYYMMGWVRTDAKVTGQHTRLWARVVVLQEGDKKIALIAGDLNAWPGGLVKAAADMNAARGFSEQNVLASASHTHAAPTGFYNFGTYNTAFMSAQNPTEFKITDTQADPQLYTFMVKQVAK